MTWGLYLMELNQIFYHVPLRKLLKNSSALWKIDSTLMCLHYIVLA